MNVICSGFVVMGLRTLFGTILYMTIYRFIYWLFLVYKEKGMSWKSWLVK